MNKKIFQYVIPVYALVIEIFYHFTSVLHSEYNFCYHVLNHIWEKWPAR